MDLKKIYKLAYTNEPFDGTPKKYSNFVITMLVAPTLEKILNNETDRLTFPEMYLYLVKKAGIDYDFLTYSLDLFFRKEAILNETENVIIGNQDIDLDLYDQCSANVLFKDINAIGKTSPKLFTALTNYTYETPTIKDFDIFAFWQGLFSQGADFGFETHVNLPENWNKEHEANLKLLQSFLDRAYSLTRTENEVLFVNQFARENNIDVETVQLEILLGLEDAKDIKLNEIKAEFKDNFSNIFLSNDADVTLTYDYPDEEIPEPEEETENLVEKTYIREKIKNNLKNLPKMIVGQEEAVQEVADTLISASVFKPVKHPMSSFILTGPTGVGKTETAKAVASLLFEGNMTTVDMTQFQHAMDINRFTGAAAGYVGYNDPNPFIDFLKSNKPGVLLFDEIEKAHPNCLNIIMRILDEGEFIDAKNNKYDLSNKVVFCTTNATANVSTMKGLGFNSSKASTAERLTEIAGIKPEIIGRFDSKIEYKKLTKENCVEIAIAMVEKEIENFKSNEENENLTINYTQDLIDKIVDNSNYELLGAREIKTNVRKYFKLPIANYIIKNDVKNCAINITENGVENLTQNSVSC